MNTLSLVAVVALCGLQTQDTTTQKTVTFTDTTLGLIFDHPATWTVVKTPKGQKASKSEKGVMVFSIPTPSAATGARLEVFHARFASTRDIWQSIQLDTNKQLHRNVDRQWEQQVLGVPLLLTRISYTDNGVATSTLTGLFYTRTHEKMLFRLTGPSADFDNLQYEFTNAMLTLRTVDGSMPMVEDPEHPLPKEEKGDAAPAAKKPLDPPKKPVPLVVPPQSVALTVSTRRIEFRYPLHWSVSNVKDTSLSLKGDTVDGAVDLSFYSTLDSDTPDSALITASSKSLNDFDLVDKRYDSGARVQPTGCTVYTVWRMGKAKSGPLYTYEAYGLQGDFYFILTFRTTAEKLSEIDRKNIDTLLKDVAILPKS
jgi:hypothetical protein